MDATENTIPETIIINKEGSSNAELDIKDLDNIDDADEETKEIVLDLQELDDAYQDDVDNKQLQPDNNEQQLPQLPQI